MAPTICLSELPIARSTVIPYSRRRQRVHNGAIVKQQRLELRRMEINVPPCIEAPLTPPESPLWEPECPNDSCIPTIVSSSSPNISARVPADMEEHWRVFLTQRDGLFDIVIRTMALIRRNNILQERVNALRAETRAFIRSVLDNPENKCRQQPGSEAPGCKDEIVSSSSEKIAVLRPLSPDSSNDVTSTCCSSDFDSDEDSLSAES